MNEITAALHGARRIALVSHRDPDPDTIGSALALGLGLESLGKRVSWHCADPVPEQQRFLHGSERFTQEPPPEDVDLVVTVDFGSVDRAKFALPSRPKLVNIDHHASNDNFGTANLVDVTAAASAELVSRVIDALGVKWTPEMATAALVGIMTDTGSFQFPSTDARALERAARLREAGADLQAITYNIFRNKRFEALKLWGFAFARLVREQAVSWSGRRSAPATSSAPKPATRTSRVSSSRSRAPAACASRSCSMNKAASSKCRAVRRSGSRPSTRLPSWRGSLAAATCAPRVR